MTLERLTERLQEEDDKVGKVDGRRFNSRSRKKMKWEMRNIEKSIFTNERRKHSNRPTYTKEELQEYKDIEDKFRADMVSSRESDQGKKATLEAPSTPTSTASTTPSPVSTPPPTQSCTSSAS